MKESEKMNNVCKKRNFMKKMLCSVLSMVFLVSVFTGIIPLQASAKGLPVQDEESITVMSYNVKGELAAIHERFSLPHDQKAWVRAPRQVQMIQEYSPDILGTSEETIIFSQVYSSVLQSEYGVNGDPLFGPSTLFHPIYGNTSIPDANRIYYKKSKFHHLTSQTIWLHDGNVFQQGKLDGETNVRGATLTVLEHKATGTRLVVANAHLSLDLNLARKQAGILKRETEILAGLLGISTILYIGDMNAVPGAIPAFYFLQNIWNAPSYNIPSVPEWQIDNIYATTPAQITGRFVVEKAVWPDRDASDHAPIIASIKLPKHTADDHCVTLYKDADYSGDRVTLGVGTSNYWDWDTVGNDSVSSVEIKLGYKITLYEHDNCQGNSMVLTSSTGWVGDNFNDKFSSARIERLY